jgi:hypothetical protein
MMTDAEINLAIAKIEWGDDFLDDDYLASLYECVDYVYNWSDIGPIIEREELDITCWGANKWSANNSDSKLAFYKEYAETPTKAACLCYLKMKGVE